ncbi:MAG: methylenetetrahydrofolate reductase [NAD(P)H] [Planctomycetota bacterium]|nr:methylenetetrahydrofolate reductase [NAD(P)H] [Planctomycetota bacterium]
MKVRDMHGRGWPVFSFEFFPPKTDEGAKTLMATVADLQEAWKPDFVSVTYGAGGSTRDRTLEVVSAIQRDLGINTMAHLTCSGTTRAEVAAIVRRLVDDGIENILALRGDPPKGDETFKAHDGGFAHATDLIEYLATEAQVSIGGACYPEGHVESTNHEDDLRWTKVKVDKGASFLITQLFFDNSRYFDYVKRARAAGIKVPIIPGIMPITNVAQVERFTQLCGASIPADLRARLERVKDDPALVMATGIEHAIKQCRKLLEGGAPGLHFYTLNKSHATRSILAAVRRD